MKIDSMITSILINTQNYIVAWTYLRYGEDNTVLTFINTQNQVIQYIITGELDEKYKQIATLINKYNPKGRICGIKLNWTGNV